MERKQKVKTQGDCSKAKHKQEEVEFLEKADLDTLAKRIFANKFTNEDLGKLGDKLSLEDRVIIRLFSFNQLNKEITEFRSNHTDWEELVDVLLYRNTCGKMKIKKPSKKKEMVPIPLPYGIKEDDITKESKVVFVTPSVDTPKVKKDKNQISKPKEEKKETAKIPEKKSIEIVEKFEISDEKLCEFIENQDDLDEWEKDVGENEDESEFNLMVPLNGEPKKPKKKRTKKEVKPADKSRPMKRKAPFHKEGNPKNRKKNFEA